VPKNANKVCPWCQKPLTLKPAEYLKIREALGMTQRQIAEKLGVKASHIAYLENGRRNPSPNLLAKIIKLSETAKAGKGLSRGNRRAER
jgi:transcriptional regulator with XRE-family HTH domain